MWVLLLSLQLDKVPKIALDMGEIGVTALLSSEFVNEREYKQHVYPV